MNQSLPELALKSGSSSGEHPTNICGISSITIGNIRQFQVRILLSLEVDKAYLFCVLTKLYLFI